MALHWSDKGGAEEAIARIREGVTKSTGLGRPYGLAFLAEEYMWHGDRAAHFVSNSMSQGACLIDGDGVIEMPSLES